MCRECLSLQSLLAALRLVKCNAEYPFSNINRFMEAKIREKSVGSRKCRRLSARRPPSTEEERKDISNSSFNPRHHWVKVSGLRIHFLAAGFQGQPVVMLHGGGLDAAGLSLRRTIPVVAERLRVFSPDWPGFGQSDSMPIKWRVEECIDFLGDFLDALGLKRAILIGVSMGGGFALGFTIRAPERVERLVLVNSAGLGRKIPGGLVSYLTTRLPFVNELWWALLTRNRMLARQTVCGPFVNQNGILSDEIVDEIIRVARRAGTGAAFRQLQRSEYRWQGLRTDYSQQLGKVKVPTLIVHGAKDTIVPVSWAERAHKLIKNSKLEIISRCGHMPPVEEPEQFNQIVRRFLLMAATADGPSALRAF